MHRRATATHTLTRTLTNTLALACAATLFGVVQAPTAAAQETGRIIGQVTAEPSLRPLDGAQVSVEGTGMGTLADARGRYVLESVPAGTHTVRVTMIGFGTARQQVTVAAGQAATLDFRLSETALALEEIVVTGTAAEVRAREVGNSLDAVTSRDIERIPVVKNSEDILAGRAPGVTIMTNSGQPGAGGTVRIRGVNTISQTAEPLIYVDGIRIYNEPTRATWGSRTGTSPLQDIAAKDIERIEVVKGAAATTLYGTEASAGVIQIFTKKGVSGAPIWTAEVAQGLNHQASFLANPDQDPADLYTKCGDLDNLYSLNLQVDETEPGFGERVYIQDPTCPSDGTWQRLGQVQAYDLSVRGGVGDVTYYMSGNYNDTQGTLPTSRSRDGGFRGNFAFAPHDVLHVSLNSSYTRRNTRWVEDGNNADGFLLNVGRGAQNYLKGGKGDDCASVPAERTCVTNRYLFETELYSQTDHFITGLTTEWRPTDAISNRLSVGWDYLTLKGETTRPFGHLYTPEGYFWDENTKHTKLSIDYAGSLRNDVGERLVSTFSWGGQVFKDRHRWTEWDVERFAGPGRPTVESGAEVTYRAENNVSQTSAGFFFQELLGFDDRLFLTGGLRVDGNSAFGDNFGLQVYPKVSASWIVSDYAFFPSDVIETFKLRAAVGESGKAPGPFAGVRTWSGVGLEGLPGVSPSDPGNPDVGPERTREIEYGFDLSALSGRIGIEATGYQARTFDALVQRDLPSSGGFLENRTENIGELESSGWEFQLTAALLRMDGFSWRARGNVSLMDSKAAQIDDDPTVDPESCINVGLYSYICEGEQVPVQRAKKILNPDELADPRLATDAEGTPIETTIGPTYPTRLFGIGTTFDIGDALHIDALLEGQFGHFLPNYTGYQNARRGSWFPCFPIQQKMIAAFRGEAGALSDVSALDRARCAVKTAESEINGGYGYDSDWWIEPADFWRLRSITLSYNVPEGLIDWGRSATVTLAARNLLTITDYTGTDPEVQDFADATGNTLEGGEFGRRDYYQIPNPRTYTLSIRVSW